MIIMKYLRYNNADNIECIGIMDDMGYVHKLDYPTIYDAIDDEENIIKQVDNLEVEDNDKIHFLTPVEPSKIICVGLNYKDHAEELEMQLPEEPLLFMKPSTSTIAHKSEIIYPKISGQVDYEGELAIVVLEKIDYDAYDEDSKIAYTIVNDVTARDLQQKDGQWTRAKSFDTFCPIGPVVSTNINPLNLNIQLKVNDTIRQDSNTNNMIFTPKQLIKHISSIMTLNKGDVIATGTPPGVGQLNKGDIVSVTIEGIGTLENRVK